MKTHHEEPFTGDEEENDLEVFTGINKVKDTSISGPADGKGDSLHNSTHVSPRDKHRDLVNDNDNQSRNVLKQLVITDFEGKASYGDKPIHVLSESNSASKQLVLFDPNSNGSNEVDVSPHLAQNQSLALMDNNHAPRVLPAVGAFTVQCANCFKWRLIPTKEKYEEIREHILDQPFFCEAAKEWRPEITCEDPADIEQDGSRLWAIDKPSIAQPPPGWERELRIRGEGRSKFADVYYVSPTGKRLRSSVDVQKHLADHPELVEQGVKLSQFSFQTPKPLQENYVRKRPARSNVASSRLLELEEGRPFSLPAPNDATVLRLGGPRVSSDSSPDPLQNSVQPKRKKTGSTALVESDDGSHNPIRIKLGSHNSPATNVL